MKTSPVLFSFSTKTKSQSNITPTPPPPCSYVNHLFYRCLCVAQTSHPPLSLSAFHFFFCCCFPWKRYFFPATHDKPSASSVSNNSLYYIILWWTPKKSFLGSISTLRPGTFFFFLQTFGRSFGANISFSFSAFYLFLLFSFLFTLSGFVCCLSSNQKSFLGAFFFLFSKPFFRTVSDAQKKKTRFSTFFEGWKRKKRKKKKTPTINQEDFDADLYRYAYGYRHRRK